MIRQSIFKGVAELRPDAEESLRALLTTLDREPELVDPDNSVVAFRQLSRQHFARFVILKDLTTADLAERGESFRDVAPLLAFLGTCDGPTEPFDHNVQRAVHYTNWVGRTVLQVHEEASR